MKVHEVRASKGTIATICEMQVADSGKSQKVLDFRGDNSIPKTDLLLNIYI